MSYKSFALVGANGVLGKNILNALITENIPFLVLTRKSSDSSSNLPASPNIKVAKVDYEDSAEVSAVLKENKVDVLISAINTAAGGKSKYVLADSAKAAGVKLFVPSEFGSVTAGASVKVLKDKDDFAKYLKKIGLPSARIFTGLFFIYLPALVGYVVDQKFNIVGKGQTKASFSALEDIGGFVAYILTHLPAEQLNDKIFRLQSEGLTLVEAAAKAGLPPNHVDKLPGDLAESFLAALQGLIESGEGSTGWDYEANKEGTEGAGSANALWPGHEWKTVTPALFSK
ncbi:NmrA-like family-domain-containing protein [Desarmillaria tabescens]|uniref:NmrA-like family-domain-containing protein n=1 Tax=Armillaria tabescens TaxID=1929756 RepID=A0AA39J6Z0_ARMTA|nr:NmrA-like family-domain-containing protein [Desarmillaria tabescens]KAK0437271.1 NmrA-like family-domain-containing protein [Desarmillaria tabescens]